MGNNLEELKHELNELKTLKTVHEKLYSLHLKTITIVVTVVFTIAAVVLGYLSIASSKEIDQAKDNLDSKLTQIQEQVNELTKYVMTTNNNLVKENYDKLSQIKNDLESNYDNLEKETELKLEKNITDFEERINELTNEGIKYSEIFTKYEGDSLNHKTISVLGNYIYKITPTVLDSLTAHSMPEEIIKKIKKDEKLFKKEYQSEKKFTEKLKNLLGNDNYIQFESTLLQNSKTDLLAFETSIIYLENTGNKIADNISARLFSSKPIELSNWTTLEQSRDGYEWGFWNGGIQYIKISPKEEWEFSTIKGRIAEQFINRVDFRLEIYYGQKNPSIAEFSITVTSED